MSEIFADTFYFLALLDQRDAHHDRVAAWAAQHRGFLLTTRWVIAEVANALGDSPIRVIATRFLRRIASDPGFRIITNSDALYDRGMELYEQRPDKAWSLTDCISFIVMQDEGTREALTADHHFKQAGFVPLFEQRP